MVALASKARQQGLFRSDILAKAISEKSAMIERGFPEYRTHCWAGQVTQDHHHALFEGVSLGLEKSSVAAAVTEEDIATGFLLYSTLVYCGESLAVHSFLHSLLDNDSPRTIIQAVVNTIQADDFQERENRQRMNEVFRHLDKMFSFQLGAILLGVSSRPQLDTMLAMDWPYFSHYTTEVEECIHGHSCSGVRHLVNSLGKVIVCLTFL